MSRPCWSLAAALGGACMLFGATPALASEVKVVDGVATFVAAPGESNQLSVASGFGYYVQFQDGLVGSPAVINTGAGCAPTQFNGPVVTTPYNFATCPGADITSISVDLGDGDDRYAGPVKHPARVDGGSGNDVLRGFEKPVTLLGGPGDDSLTGSERSDVLDGGPGADDILGGDPYSAAGPSTGDLVDYSSRTAPVTVTLDDVANDGEAGEGDNVHSDVDDIAGGSGDDTLTGSAGENRIDGGAGDDTITGGDGPDALTGGAGDDTINAQDGFSDQISCGAGDDSVAADADDVVADDCEHVSLPAAVEPPAPVTPPVDAVRVGDAPLSVSVTIASLAARGLKLHLRCSSTCTVAADVRVSRKVARSLGLKSVVIGRTAESRYAGGTSAVTVKLTATARKALKRLRGRTLTVFITATDAAGHGKTSTASFKTAR
ncbi:calcium-binding protein [Solirubrobacter soli]|uniref:calcium-binding protein n=1 Tax=Solirubrobacter soli TaxID=363832 RepID=UPI00042A57BF|nr:calcium-binding protein [Solirubrobacter soli]